MLDPTRIALPMMPQVDEQKARGLTSGDNTPELREQFDQFVGETFYSQMLSAMRDSLGKPAYFHGGRAEEIFQGQLDQVLAEQMTKASADTFTGPMFELFTLTRS
jgi:Rod binding domain-containing protein